MKRNPKLTRVWFGLAVLAIIGAFAGNYLLPDRSTNTPAIGTILVHKSATCTCCSKWVEHLRKAGFKVEVHNDSDLNHIKQVLGVPESLSSCHTAMVNGYVIEGHVPAADIRRLMVEKPAIRGLAVPGMPIGSPGMEARDKQEPYDVLAIPASGEATVFARH